GREVVAWYFLFGFFACRLFFARTGIHARKRDGSEMIIHAGADHAELVAVRDAGNAEARIRQIDIEIFDLRGPVLGESEFGADARGPARRGVGLRETEGFAAQFAERETAGAVEQDVVEGVADPAARRAEPRVGEFPGREG